MEIKLKGYKCLLCEDVIYKRTRWDNKPTCRCGNIFFGESEFKCIVCDKHIEVKVVLGEGVDENILERDEAESVGEYGRIESEIDEGKLNNFKTQILLLKE